MKIIFLDIDGVISTEKSHYALDKDACDLLGNILNHLKNTYLNIL